MSKSKRSLKRRLKIKVRKAAHNTGPQQEAMKEKFYSRKIEDSRDYTPTLAHYKSLF